MSWSFLVRALQAVITHAVVGPHARVVAAHGVAARGRGRAVGDDNATVTGAGLPFCPGRCSPAAVSILVTTSGMDSAEPSAAQDLPSRNRNTTSFVHRLDVVGCSACGFQGELGTISREARAVDGQLLVVDVVMRAVEVATVGFAETSATTMPVPWAICRAAARVNGHEHGWPAVWRHILPASKPRPWRRRGP